MSTDQLREIERVFHAARDLPVAQRNAYIHHELPNNPGLIEEVEALLAAAEQNTDFLEATLLEGDEPPGGATTSLQPGRMIGPYRLVRELGRGGMGVVYEAEQSMPRRRVALKVIHGGLLGDGAGHWRLAHEPRILGRLNHPSIATIYDASQTLDGLSYFVMELIEGDRLDQFVKARAVPRRDRLKLFCKVCDAIQHAHAKSVIHLDLKPSNILVSGPEGAAVDELQVKVVDFGVAAITGTDTTVPTRVGATGGLPGTLAYMSPEQRRGQRDAIDVRSDVYALGVILFKLMTGELPYPVEGLPYADAWRLLTEELPRRPRALDPGVPPDVETIIRAATADEPARRYQSVAELAGDVRRYLADMPISARPPSKTYEWTKFAQRNKGLVGTLAALLLGLTATIIGTSLGLVRARAAEVLARDEARNAKLLAELVVTRFDLRGDADAERETGSGPPPTPVIQLRSALEPKRTAAKNILAEGRVEEAALEYDGLVKISRLLLPEPNWYVATLEGEYGRCLLALRRYEAAETQLLSSYKDFHTSLGDEHMLTSDAVKDLAKFYITSGHPEKAASWTALLSTAGKASGH